VETNSRDVSVALVRRLQASAAEVYAAWTEPKLVARWLAPDAGYVVAVTNDLRAGGGYRIDGIDKNGNAYVISGTYLALATDRQVVLSWRYEGPAVALRGDASTVCADLRSLGPDQTELTVTHVRIATPRAADLNRENWLSCLEKLGDALAPGRPSPSPPPIAQQDDFFREGHRAWQDHFETTRLADRVRDAGVKRRIDASDAAFIAHQNMFFLASVDGSGQPTCAYKGGARGFVRVIDDKTLAFPLYDGNGMYLSVGNVAENSRVALLFIDFERQARLRLHGTASARADDRLLPTFPGAELVVRVKVTALLSNCPRYIHKMQLVEESAYVPNGEPESPGPAWKSLADFTDVLPERDAHLAGDDTDDAAAFNRD
jgi:uncharacterized protein YndB with AHSA1/START domain/predicted pyridoxine 5'-phosphate oxidase superfamily flavin-nucleotide-binding protein